MSRQRVHLFLGLATVVVFLGTGLYMRYHAPPVPELEPGLRMLFRSRHIYILLTGLLNLTLGLQVGWPGRRWPGRLAGVGSTLVMSAPPLLVAAFFFETSLGSPSALSVVALELVLAGCLLHAGALLWARWTERRARDRDPSSPQDSWSDHANRPL